MALNLEDLIGSMQHNLSAGDRGNDIHDIRESLLVSLGPSAMGPNGYNGQSTSSQHRSTSRHAAYPQNPSSSAAAPISSYAQQHPSQAVDGAAWTNGYASHEGGGAAGRAEDSGAMDLSSSLDNTAGSSSDGWGQSAYSYGSSGRLSRVAPGSNAALHGQASSPSNAPSAWATAAAASAATATQRNAAQVGSFGANSYSSSGSVSSTGHGFVPAPANTPQQTPVERSTLSDHFVHAQGGGIAGGARGPGGARFSPVAEQNDATSPGSAHDGAVGVGEGEGPGVPAKITRGFGDAQRDSRSPSQ